MRDKTTLSVQVMARVGNLRTDLKKTGGPALPISARSHLPQPLLWQCREDPQAHARHMAGFRERCGREESAEQDLGGCTFTPCITSCPPSPLPSCSPWLTLAAPAPAGRASHLLSALLHPPPQLEGAFLNVAPPPTCPCKFRHLQL